LKMETTDDDWVGPLAPFYTGGGDRAIAGGAVLTSAKSRFRPKQIFAAFLSKGVLNRGDTRMSSKLWTVKAIAHTPAC
jgi:hypothetical protein